MHDGKPLHTLLDLYLLLQCGSPQADVPHTWAKVPDPLESKLCALGNRAL
jgi:hypothetical protein